MENKTFAKPAAAAFIDEGLRQFMIKVYNYMFGALCVTALAAFLTVNTSLIRLFFNINAAGQVSMSGFGYLILFAPLVLVFWLNSVIRNGSVQKAQAIFWGYAALMGISLSPIMLAYTHTSLTKVFLISAATFGGMSLYGYTTKKSLDSMGSFLYMGVWGLILCLIINMFWGNSMFDFVLSVIGVGIFTGLAAYDTQKIRQIYYEQDTGDVSSRKAIYGALSLYLDFINLFIYMLRLLGDRK